MARSSACGSCWGHLRLRRHAMARSGAHSRANDSRPLCCLSALACAPRGAKAGSAAAFCWCGPRRNGEGVNTYRGEWDTDQRLNSICCTTMTTPLPTTTTTSERGTTAAKRTTNMQKSRCSQHGRRTSCARRATRACGDCWSRNRRRPQMHAHVQVLSRL